MNKKITALKNNNNNKIIKLSGESLKSLRILAHGNSIAGLHYLQSTVRTHHCRRCHQLEFLIAEQFPSRGSPSSPCTSSLAHGLLGPGVWKGPIWKHCILTDVFYCIISVIWFMQLLLQFLTSSNWFLLHLKSRSTSETAQVQRDGKPSN